MDSTAELAKWFWSIVTDFENVQRAKLLQYATGSSRVPISGFGALRGESPKPNLSSKCCSGATAKDQNAIKPFTLVLVVSRHPDSLPIAHTCFNRIDIPLYPSREVFSANLTQAIDETMGFHVD